MRKMTTEAQKTGPDAFEKFASQALRRNKIGSYEQLLCQHLIKAVASDPIEKIRLTCEAALMVPDPPIDTKKLDIIFQIVSSFTSTQVYTNQAGDNIHWLGQIAWSMENDESHFKKYIKPWLTSPDRLYYIGSREGREKISVMTDPAERFWAITQTAHISTLENLKARFTVWAMPETMRIFEALSKLVNPDLYDSMLEKMRV